MTATSPASCRPGIRAAIRPAARRRYRAPAAIIAILCAALLTTICAISAAQLGSESAFAGSVATSNTHRGGAAASLTRADVASSLVINEVDYDQPGSDTLEFVEIYNAGGEAVGLDGVSVLGVNGDGVEYRRTALPDVTLVAGDWFVVGSASVPNVDLVDGTTNIYQNGAPDAIALVFTATGDPADEILVDSVSYEGETTGGPVNGGSWTEGAGGAPADDGTDDDVSIARYPDGVDTDMNADDFDVSCATPGEANSPDATCDASPTPTPSATGTASPDPSETLTPSETPTPGDTPSPGDPPTATPTPEDIGGLAVELVDLSAERRADGAVVMTWRTLSEIDHAGFRLLREAPEGLTAGPLRSVGDLIPARGDAFAGADYRTVDRAAPPERIRYWLEDVDTLGRATRHGPVIAPAIRGPAGYSGARYTLPSDPWAISRSHRPRPHPIARWSVR